MKKFLTLVLVLSSSLLFAQAPKQIPYQGVARTSTGAPVINQLVSLRLTIEEGPGTALFQEVHQTTTNAFGLFSVQIGSLEELDIVWGGPMKFLHVELDIAGGNNYVDLGTTAFLSVPYALYAENSGTPGPQGIQGEQGPVGPQGEQGPAGPQGPIGLTGPAGATGQAGAVGPQGIQGEPGPVGPQGQQGPIGLTGPAGATGQAGAVGPQGIQGEQGPVGPQGEQGPAGPQGPIGLTGPAGATGEAGAVGPQGIQGEQGPAGPQGPIGLTGPAGAIGATGPQGPIGLTGPAGATGATGPQGPIGLTGPAGSTGATGNGYSNGTMVNQINYWNGSEWVLLNPGANGETLTICNNELTWTYGGQCPNVAVLDCNNSVQTGEITIGNPINGVLFNIPYSGGNGATYSPIIIASTAVTGLVASSPMGTLNMGNGQLVFVISGTPSNSGTADFVLNFAGQQCIFSIDVNPNPIGTYRPGMVHCGMPTLVVDIVSPNTGRIWMDRNLGASQVATSMNDANALGDLYQWGRFADGHQCRNSQTTTTTSNSDTPPTNRFILPGSFPNDWRNPQNANLWQGESGMNNPCPIGYRLPTSAEVEAEPAINNGNNLNAYNSFLKLTAGGTRDYTLGEILGLATNPSLSNGSYWTSDSFGSSSVRLFLRPTTNTTDTPARANGCSIRCIKDL